MPIFAIVFITSVILIGLIATKYFLTNSVRLQKKVVNASIASSVESYIESTSDDQYKILLQKVAGTFVGFLIAGGLIYLMYSWSLTINDNSSAIQIVLANIIKISTFFSMLTMPSLAAYILGRELKVYRKHRDQIRSQLINDSKNLFLDKSNSDQNK